MVYHCVIMSLEVPHFSAIAKHQLVVTSNRVTNVTSPAHLLRSRTVNVAVRVTSVLTKNASTRL